MQLKDITNFPKTLRAEKETNSDENTMLAETRITGLFGDSEHAKGAVEELKGAGFGRNQLAVAMQDSAAQENFIAETEVHMVAAEEVPSIPELDAGQVILLVEAADQASLALEIITRRRGITGGVRMPS